MLPRPYTVLAAVLSLCGLVACSSDPSSDPDASADVGADIGSDAVEDAAEDTAVDAFADTDTGGVVCGDGVIDGPYEQCEPSIALLCADVGFTYGIAACGSDCIADTSGCSVVPICGDGSVDGDEECDDGGRVDNDGCNADCGVERCGDDEVNGTEECDGDRAISCSDGTLGVLACTDDCAVGADTCLEVGTCGDGIVDSDESCDDGNTIPGDGCDASCLGETCGDGSRQGQERCDGNDLGDETCQSLGFDTGTLYCSGACRLDTERCVVAVCGDGVQDAGEACDDGNRTSGDGCSRTCVIERCGDGRADVGIGEQCDGIDVQGLTCADFGFALAPLSCGSDCRVDLSGCERLPRCGDGTVDDTLGESCDDGNETNNDGCSTSCIVETCGDGLVQTNEVCEPGIAPSSSCVDEGYLAGQTGCTAACELDTSACIDAGCGNGLLDVGEQCDGLLSSAACLDEGFDFGRLDCTDECTFEPDGCRFLAMCGDGVRAGTEECDDGNSIDGDGCSLDCIVEECGDGIVQPALAEQCEGSSALVVLGCGTGGDVVGTTTCAACVFEPTQCFESECGNGIVEIGESCDDGNRVELDGCDPVCVSETCDDGIVQSYEACDGFPGAAVCDDIGFADGVVGCNACALDYSACGSESPVCGNGLREFGEACDAGVLNDDVADMCRTDCTLPRCGDGIVDTDETCDPGLDVTCPDYCVAAGDAFLVPTDGTLAQGVASDFDLILVLEDQSDAFVTIDRDLVVRGIGEDVSLTSTGIPIFAANASALTLQNLTLLPVGVGAFAVDSDDDLVLDGVMIVAESQASCVRQQEPSLRGGTLVVRDSQFVGCTSVGYGGSLYSEATAVSIERTTFEDSTANGYGGAICLFPVIGTFSVSIIDVDIRDASVTWTSYAEGGGIVISYSNSRSEPMAATLDIDGLTVVGCTAEAQRDFVASASGGGLLVEIGGPQQTLEMTARDVRLANNSVSCPNNSDPNTHTGIGSGGAVALSARTGATFIASFEDFEISGNSVNAGFGYGYGGGFDLLNEPSGESSLLVTLRRGLIVNNDARSIWGDLEFGGGVAVRAVGGTTALEMTNVTLTRNAAEVGGGLHLGAAADAGELLVAARHTTIAANSATGGGGGIFAEGAAVTLRLAANIIVGNTSNVAAEQQCTVDGVNAFSQYNIAPLTECGLVNDGTNVGDNAIGVLGTLANNGSVFRTMLPIGGRDINPGCVADGELITVDQRGSGRTDGACDAGAAEAQDGE